MATRSPNGPRPPGAGRAKGRSTRVTSLQGAWPNEADSSSPDSGNRRAPRVGRRLELTDGRCSLPRVRIVFETARNVNNRSAGPMVWIRPVNENYVWSESSSCRPCTVELPTERTAIAVASSAAPDLLSEPELVLEPASCPRPVLVAASGCLAMTAVDRLIERLGPTNVTVAVLGETGTGKGRGRPSLAREKCTFGPIIRGVRLWCGSAESHRVRTLWA